MDKIILQDGDYSFDASAKIVKVNQDIKMLNAECLLTITNLTANNTIIYAFGCPGMGGVFFGNQITLTYNTNITAMSDTDKLQIILYKPNEISDNEYLRKIEKNTNNLTEVIQLLKEQVELTKQMF